MRREHMTHTTEDWHNSPLPKQLTVPPGRGGGHSGGPSGQTRTGTQDGDLQSRTDRQGPWRSWELWKPWRCRELRRPWQIVFGALASVPSARPLQPEPFLPPQNISLGKSGGIRSPPGLNRQDSTRQDRKALRGQTDRTRQHTGTGSPPGQARNLRLLLGMTRHQGPSQGSLRYRFHICDTGGRRLGMASSAMTWGAAYPRWVSVDKTRQLKCSCGHNKT